MRLSVLLALLTSGVAPAAVAQVTRLPEAVARFGQERAATSLLVRGTTDVPLFAPLLTAFAETVPELSIVYEQWASNDLSHLAEAACRGEIDPPDLIISSAVDQQVKLVNDGCAEPHRSVATAALPREANWRDELFGVTEEPAVIIYNRDLVPPGEEPRSRFDLLDLLRRPNSPYVGRVATYDIESSGLGYLFAFANSQQATTFGSLIEAFGRSGAIATCCSVEIINGVAEGLYLAAYNVLGSYALDRAEETAYRGGGARGLHARPQPCRDDPARCGKRDGRRPADRLHAVPDRACRAGCPASAFPRGSGGAARRAP